MRRGYYRKAYQNLILLRFHPLLAAKELLYVHYQMEVEGRFLVARPGVVRRSRPSNGTSRSTESRDQSYEHIRLYYRATVAARPVVYWRRMYQLFTIKRNQRALVAAVVVMGSQQLCGINALQFFSSTLYCDARGGKSPDANVVKPGDLQPLFLSWGIGLANFIFVSVQTRTISTATIC